MTIEFAKADYDDEERAAVNRVMSAPLLASGPENEAFEKEFAEYVQTKNAVLVNSGSSANLLALASLNLPNGAKVLTSACGFPATLSPIIHLGLTPMLVDYELGTHNIDVEKVIQNIHKVQAVMLAHTMGNPVDIQLICTYAKMLGVPVIEDCCEAAGTFIDGKSVGSFGTLGTFSFYPAHQITALGGGGMVVTNDEKLYERMKSLRDWGKTFAWDSSTGGNVTDYSSSIGYHRGYTYDTIGWNFKLPEANAAFGRVQLRKLDRFAAMRQYRHEYLRMGLADLTDFVQIREWPAAERISWFGHILTVKDGSVINRNELGNHLESKGIRTRPFFAGNILRQPAFRSELAEQFPVADKLMKDSLFVGCHTKMTGEDMDYIIKTVRAYVDSVHSELQRSGHASGIDSVGISADVQAG